MRTVHKLKIDFQVTDYKLPRDATVIQFCKDGMSDLCIWYVFNRKYHHMDDYVHRKFRIFGTNHDIPDGYTFVGTAICGELVWHLFEDESNG